MTTAVIDDSKALLHAHLFDGAGGSGQLDIAALRPTEAESVAATATPAAGNPFAWIHLNARHADSRKILKETLGVPPLVIKALLAEETRPRIEDIESGTLVILRGIGFHPGPAPEDLVSIRLWVTPGRIITLGRRKSKAIADMMSRVGEGICPRRPGEFVSLLASSLADGVELALEELDGQMSALEDKNPQDIIAPLRDELAAIRKQATIFRRHILPQRDVMARLAQTVTRWVDKNDRWYLQDNLDRLTRLIEELDVLRERSLIVQDEVYNALSAHLNRNLYVLSVITAIFMPLSFITGLLGMNVPGIPAAGHPAAFWIVCAALALIVALQLYLFRRMKWL